MYNLNLIVFITGCICKEDGDCGGGQRLLDLTRAAPLGDSETSNSHSSTVAIVLSVVFLTIATVTLVVLYYRRRMKRMEKDLANRSVYYVENSALDPGRHHNGDLVITGNFIQEPTIYKKKRKFPAKIFVHFPI